MIVRLKIKISLIHLILLFCKRKKKKRILKISFEIGRIRKKLWRIARNLFNFSPMKFHSIHHTILETSGIKHPVYYNE